MPEQDDVTRRLRSELERMTPDAWPQIRRRVAARRAAAELLAALEAPPSPGGRLYWELRLRLSRSDLRKAG
jgi:hypothetical protein